MKRFWFFDLDGTLADTDPDIRASWKAALADLSLDCPSFDEVFVAGPPIDEMARILFPDRFTPALAEAIRTGFARHYDHDGFPNTKEYSGVLDEIRRLKADGCIPAIVTNKRFAAARAMARHFAWDTLFTDVFAGDMHKDDPAIGKLRKPELLRWVLSKYGASPDEAVLVGDTISDFEAAEKNGIRSIGVSWGYGTDEELARADCLIHRPDELRTCGKMI